MGVPPAVFAKEKLNESRAAKKKEKELDF